MFDMLTLTVLLTIFSLDPHVQTDPSVLQESGSQASQTPGDQDRQIEELNKTIATLYQEGRYEEALPIVQQQLELIEQRYGPHSLEAAQARNDLAEVLRALGELPTAKLQHQQALRLREEISGPESLPVAESCNNLAYVLAGLGEYQRAMELSRKGLGIRERILGLEHLDVATSLENLALLYHDLGDYKTPLPMYERVLRIRLNRLKPEHTDVATAYNNLAFLLEDRGDYVGARQLYEKALDIEEKVEGPEHPNLALTLSNLAHLLQFQGDYETARKFLERALFIREKALDRDTAVIAASLNNLAYLLEDQGQLALARPLYERSLQIRETTLGLDHPAVATALNNLARLLALQGDFHKAKALYDRALAIRRKKFGSLNVEAAESLNNLATLYRDAGKYRRARKAIQRALKIFEDTLGTHHPSYARALKNYGRIQLSAGDLTSARRSLLESARIEDLNLNNLLYTLSLAEQRAFLQEQITPTISLLLSTSRGDAWTRDAYAILYRWKGLLVFSLGRQSQISKLAADSSASTQLLQLRELRVKISEWFRGAGTVPLSQWKDEGALLNNQKEALERSLARAVESSDLLEDSLHSLTLSQFQRLLEPDEAFIDVYRYLSSGSRPGSERYTALVVTRDAGPVVADLGGSEEVSAMIDLWRQEVLLGGDAGKEWAEVSGRVWKPIANMLPATLLRVWMSPDGELARLPWHLLPSSESTTRQVLLGQVDSARELVLLKTRKGSSSAREWLLVGRTGNDLDSRSSLYPALPGAAREIRLLQELAGKHQVPFTVLAGGDATKAAVMAKLSSARFVHLATHGFFYREPEMAAATKDSRFRASLRERTSPISDTRSPLAESGILLMPEANPLLPEKDGALTAEELVGLDLSQCEMFVLSACDTGRGQEVTGQGVMGLRAAILASGARSALLSLWKVPDEPTAILMQEFYRNILEKRLGKLEALMRAQEALRDDPSGKYHSPINWAAWALVGEAW